MDNLFSKKTVFRINYWLPSVIAIIVTLVSIMVWYCLLYNDSLIPFISLKTSLPFIILILGILCGTLFAIAIYLTQLSKLQSHNLDRMNEHFNQELIDHMHAEKSKQELEKALLQSQKLQAVGTLASGIAHDFNNILYAIIGYTEILREDVERNSLIYNNLGKILEASYRGKELITRILAFSRGQKRDFKEIDLKKMIESVLALLRPTIPSTVIIQLNVLLDMACNIKGDMTQLHQVIVNIINNAVDAMDREGTITITLDRVADDNILLKQIPNHQDSSYCRIEISDTGHGMDQSTLNRIFEPFFTTKEVGKGTGLGLSTAHTIMLEHQGALTVISQLGHGTTFTLLLPELKENENADDFISGR
jgi:signal transduction histidine kinase